MQAYTSSGRFSALLDWFPVYHARAIGTSPASTTTLECGIKEFLTAFREDFMAASPSPDSLPGLAVLEQTPIIIEKIVWSATDEQLHWKPATDRWSISEVLAHLAEAEVVGFRERVQMMMEKDNPRLEAYDQNAAHAVGK
jgi:hypothetical protein